MMLACGGRVAAGEAAGGRDDPDGCQAGSLGGSVEHGGGPRALAPLHPGGTPLRQCLGFVQVVGVGGSGFVDELVALWWPPPPTEVVSLMFRL
jgi:hypothetical protein